MPSATAVWPSAIPTATASANRQREVASIRTRPPYSAEQAVPGEEAAREVAGRVGQHRDDQDPVERRRAGEQVVLDRPAQRERHDHEQQPEPELDRRRHPQVLGALHAARVAVGDRAREQLLHRPVEHRHGDEHRRPQQRDPAVLVLGQRVAREREVGERDEPGGADPHRQDRRPAAVAEDCLEPDKQHGPGEGRAGLLDRAVAREQRHEPALGPVVHVSGRVAEVAPVRAARHVEPAPERLARHRDQQVPRSPRAPSPPAWPPARARARAPRSPRPGRTRRRANESRVASSARNSRFGRSRFAHSARSFGSSRSMPTMRPSPSRSAHSTVSTPSPQPTSRTDAGRRARPQLVERRVEAGHQPPDDRVGGPVLVEGVAGRDLGGGGARAAHSFSASRSSVLPVARPASRAGGGRAGRSPSRRARSARARRRGAARSAAPARECAAGGRACRRGCRRSRRARRAARRR